MSMDENQKDNSDGNYVKKKDDPEKIKQFDLNF